ncbi:hypothetical protein TEA_022457 [Camellia sinensis var. sinensis]|uniref:HMG box domain-containing protein n=1 Tax=Camellia sinensis var. sinensis TaxID=542762 RepID=A0A4V3WKW8_CAMSN|nr:hypothetical protein TEA_022457 [Camellia sinensis var. sinensis]
MKGPKATSIAHKKIDSEYGFCFLVSFLLMVKKRKADANAKKEKANKKNSGAPKRPSSAFFVFILLFTITNLFSEICEFQVGKAGGVKWKEMSESEKAPYVAKAMKKKAEYEKAMEEFNSKLNGNGELKPDESGKSSSEVHDENEQEASS